MSMPCYVGTVARSYEKQEHVGEKSLPGAALRPGILAAARTDITRCFPAIRCTLQAQTCRGIRDEPFADLRGAAAPGVRWTGGEPSTCRHPSSHTNSAGSTRALRGQRGTR